jgi:hypothetical protein
MLLVETLESRRLLASTAPVFGTYRGTEMYNNDGLQQSLKATVTISPVAAKSSAVTAQSNEPTDAGLAIVHQLAPQVVMALFEIETFEPTLISDAVVQTHVANSAAPLATTVYVASLNSSAVSATTRVEGNNLEISETVSTGIFAKSTITFSGTRVATTKTSVAASQTTSSVTTLAARPALNVNPVRGAFKGHMTRQSDSEEFKTSAVVADNKKGKPAINFSLVEPGVGTIEIQSEIRPTHTGSFTLDLGGLPTDGILHGHITHTGRLVLNLVIPGVSDLAGSQKRRG